MNNPPPLPNKPEWLKKLEEESWQAELIISGLAIYGTLQMPELLEWFLDWCLASVSDRFFTLLYLFFTYLGLGVYFLIFIFIGHFVLRTVWIGLVGLNSVFPQGINEESDNYSKHFIRQFKADYLDQNTRIGQLDEVCSVLFGLGAQLVMIFTAINIDLVVLGGIWYALDRIFGSLISTIFILFCLALFIIYALFLLICNLRKFRDHPLVRKWQYPIYKQVNRVLLHLFARPGTFLAMIFQTNLSLKRYAGIVVSMMLIVFIFFGARFLNYRFVSLLNPNILTEHFDRADRLLPEHYANLRKDKRRLLSLELESDVISGDFLRVFVPVLTAESSKIEGLCGTLVTQGAREEKRTQNREYYTNCYQQMHRFYLNDALYPTPDVIKYEHPNQGEDGILVYLPTAGLTPGKQLLRVEKIGPKSDEVFRQMQAVFWFEGVRSEE